MQDCHPQYDTVISMLLSFPGVFHFKKGKVGEGGGGGGGGVEEDIRKRLKGS